MPDYEVVKQKIQEELPTSLRYYIKKDNLLKKSVLEDLISKFGQKNLAFLSQHKIQIDLSETNR